MTYLGAASKADVAKRSASNASQFAQSTFDREIAGAIESLAEAVGELARSIHPDSD